MEHILCHSTMKHLHPVHTTFQPGSSTARHGINCSVNELNRAVPSLARHDKMRWAGLSYPEFRFNVNAPELAKPCQSSYAYNKINKLLFMD